MEKSGLGIALRSRSGFLARAHGPMAVLLALVACLFVAPAANAGFIGYYSPGNFTLVINDNSVETVNCQVSSCPSMLPNALLTDLVNSPDSNTLNFTADQSGSGFAGFTDLIIIALASGPVQFHWSYSTMDIDDSDAAGYVVDGAFTQFANGNGQSGDASFMVSAGQTFGFRITTVDNLFGPGALTLTAFDAAVPEPGTAPILLLLGVAAIAVQKGMSRRRKRASAS